MNYLLALLVFCLCFAGMAIGILISQRILQKGCSVSPDDCRCRAEGKDPDQCDYDPADKQQA